MRAVLVIITVVVCAGVEAVKANETGRNMPPGRSWAAQGLRKIPIAYRHDGFSIFFRKPPMDRRKLEELFVDPMAHTNAAILVWGLGPGSVFCYETKIGQIFGEGLNEAQRKMLRTGDLWAHENVMGLIREGPGPLAMAVARSHQLGLKIFARLEMNHEYGPAKEDNWAWVGFVGDLNKKHPEYRIPKTVLLDFKHKEVRDFKIAILREAAEAGVDGVCMDFVVYPPYFEKPSPEIMNQFLRDVRAMLDEVGRAQGRRLEVMARVPFTGFEELSLDWKTWLREKRVDIIVPTHLRPADYFDIRVEEFVSLARQTGTLVYPTIWQALGFVGSDPDPSDEATGRQRYDKPKTKEMYFAQALLFHRQGADGLQLGMASDAWRTQPWMNDLADPEKVLFADKHYMADPISIRPGTFALSKKGGAFSGALKTGLRIGDDVASARAAGHGVEAALVVYCRPLAEGERLGVYVNRNGPVEISGESAEEKSRRGAKVIDPRKEKAEGFIFEKEWWRRGEHALKVPAEWWRLQDNDLELVYSAKAPDIQPPLSITWIDLLLKYPKANGGDSKR